MTTTEIGWYYVIVCLAAGAAYAAVLYWIGARRMPRGARWVASVARTLAVALLVFLLAAPVARRTVAERQRPRVAVITDRSLSVAQSADSSFSTLDSLQPIADRVELMGIDAGSTHHTDLGSPLAALRGSDVAAIVLATDGLHNRGTSPISIAEGLTCPVYCIALGDTVLHSDASVGALRAPRTATQEGEFAVEMTIVATGMQGHQARLRIADAAGRTLSERRITYSDPQHSQTITTTLPAGNSGLQRFDIELEPLEGELTDRNNRLAFYVDVIDSRRKIAIIAAAPHPDVSALAQAINSTDRLEAEVVDVADAESGRWKPDGRYDMAVLHNLPSARHPRIEYADNLPCLCVIGLQTDLSRFNALGWGISITSRTKNSSEVTATADPSFNLFTLDPADLQAIESLPPLTAPFGQARLSSNMQTMLRARVSGIDSRQPLLCATSSGDRRRIFLWGEGFWRWRMADYAEHLSHRLTDHLMGQIVAFATADPIDGRLRIEVERSYPADEPIPLRATLLNQSRQPINQPPLQITITRADTAGTGKSYDFRPDGEGYSLSLPPLPEGVYRYVAEADSQRVAGAFAVEASNLELQRLQTDLPLLSTLAEATGGTLYRTHQTALLCNQLRDTLKPVIYSHTRHTEWLRLPLVLMAVLLLLTTEWLLRKYHGER